MYQADLRHDQKNLQEKLQMLFSLSPQRVMELGFRPPYIALLEKLNNPHLALPPTVHIAGTNGKGSTLAMMKSCLEALGSNVHRFTSPHLHKFNERIVLAGQQISDDALEQLIDEMLELNDGAPITFFEITSALAFAAYSRDDADILLLETGLGGRLDCSNIIERPELCLISKISFDHMEHLGESLEEIASEKAGIIKEGRACIIGAQMDMARILPIFEARANALNAPLYVYGRDWDVGLEKNRMIFRFGEHHFDFPLPALAGAHQVENAGLALGGLYLMQDKYGWDVQAFSKGLEAVSWAGRLEPIKRDDLECEIWYDGGHNDSAALALAEQMKLWAEQDGKELHLIVGMKKDKDLSAFLEPLAQYARSLSIVPVHKVGACLSIDDVPHLTAKSVDMQAAASIEEALKEHDSAKKRVLICGSLYLAEQIQ